MFAADMFISVKRPQIFYILGSIFVCIHVQILIEVRQPDLFLTSFIFMF